MKCACKIIILIVFLTTLTFCALYTAQNLQVISLSKALIGFKNTKKTYSNLSPSPSPSPSQAPLRHHHVQRQNSNHLPLLVPRSEVNADETRMLLVAVLVLSACAAATCMICFVLVFVSFKRLRTHGSTKSISTDMKGEENEAEHEQVYTVKDVLSNCEDVDSCTSVAASVRSLKYDESFHSFCETLPSCLPSSSGSGSNRTLTVTTSPPLPPPVVKGCQPRKDGTRLPKLKPLHWDKVRAASDHSMVWDKLKSSSFEFDEELIESLFSYNLHNTNEELKNKSPSPGNHVLEPKRLQNLTILFKALNATAEQVCCALVQGIGLNLQQLEVLMKMEPTKEEEAKITSYKGDLGSAEAFIATILTVPYAFQRVQALLYRETFEDELTHLRTTFSVLEEACKELRSSRLFLKLLEAVLKMGNRMNVGTIRGGAQAFKLDALLKLADVKGTDGKTTLLQFVVEEIVRSEGVRASDSIIGKINQKNKHRNIQDKEDDYRNMGLELVGGLSTELCNVKKTATIDFHAIVSSVSNLSQGMCRLRTLVNQDLKFGESMKCFFNDAEKHVKELQEDEHKVMEIVKEMTKYFHGSVSKDDENPLRIFVIVRDFLVMLDRVCRELRRSKVFAPF